MSAPKGVRNETLNSKAYALGRLVARGWISAERVTQGLFTCAGYCGLVQDDGEAAVIATIRSGLLAGLARPYPDLN